MKINGINYLTLEKRGCNFWKDAPEWEYSDVGNYRVFTQFTDKNGVNVCGDFGGHNVRNYEKRNKPIIRYNALHTDLQYTNEKNECYCYNGGNPENYSYTLSDILNYVNSISNEKFDDIKFVHTFEFIQEKGENFVPANKMVEHAKNHRLNFYHNEYFTLIIDFYSGKYQYLRYDIQPVEVKEGEPEKEKVTIYMEEIKK